MPKRLLIVDDDPDIRSLSCRLLLATNGWEVIEADCGDRCAELARSEQPDAILLDIAMPGRDGMTTLKQLKADPETRAIPVLLFTGGLVPNDQAIAGAGAAGCVQKPFDPLRLGATIAGLLGWEL
jgi:CheY-like chemotaxis protein